MDFALARRLKAQLERERGGVAPLAARPKEAPLRAALLYPSPYRAAMSSLGFLTIHRLLCARQGTSCVRATLPEDGDLALHLRTQTPLLSLETQRPVSELDVLAFSFAYELELAGLVTLLELAGLSPLACDRRASDPLVVLGGPITFSNPIPCGPFADLILLGEAEETLDRLFGYLEDHPEAARGSSPARNTMLETFAAVPGFYVPRIHGEHLPPIAQVELEHLPAYSTLRTKDTELSDMVLIEPERGCHRGCTFCVMRRSTNGGMRLVDPKKVLAVIPAGAERVGLVGAAVSDHPGIKGILREIVDLGGKRVGISSLRADRLDEEFVALLARGGYRSMTVALDAPSERLRDAVEKNLKERHVERAAELAAAENMMHLKIYTVVSLPDERPADLDELLSFASRLARKLPVVLSVSPFIPKFHTPLAGAPFAGEVAATETLRYLKSRLPARVALRGPSAKEAYVEYRLAQGGFAQGRAAIAAAAGGSSLSSWKRALRDLPERSEPDNFRDLVPAPTMRRRSLLKLERLEQVDRPEDPARATGSALAC